MVKSREIRPRAGDLNIKMQRLLRLWLSHLSDRLKSQGFGTHRAACNGEARLHGWQRSPSGWGFHVLSRHTRPLCPVSQLRLSEGRVPSPILCPPVPPHVVTQEEVYGGPGGALSSCFVGICFSPWNVIRKFTYNKRHRHGSPSNATSPLDPTWLCMASQGHFPWVQVQ